MAMYALNAYASDNWIGTSYVDKLVASGTQYVRVDVKYDPTSNVPYLKALKDRGLKVLGIFAYDLAPWDSVANKRKPIVDLNDWRTLVQRALTNYDGLIDAIELWNEPDLSKYWSGYMDGTPEHYIQLLQVLSDELHARGLNIPVYVGSIAVMVTGPVGSTSSNYGASFLQKLKDLGADDYCAGYSFHVYSWFLTGNQGLYMPSDVYNKGKAIVGNKPLWETEMGHDGTDTERSEWLGMAFSDLNRVQCPFITWYPFVGGETGDYGLLNADLSERPAYYTFQSFAKALVTKWFFKQWQDGDRNPTKTIII